VTIEPFVSIKASLGRSEPVDLFEVTADRPTYWRVLVLTEFDGTTWRPEEPGDSPDLVDLVGGAEPPHGVIGPGRTTTAAFRSLHTIEAPWLPIATPPMGIEVPGRQVRWDPSLAAATFDGDLEPGTTWSVASRSLRPTPAGLRSATVTSFSSAAVALPGDLSPAVARIARNWTADQTDPYHRVLAIQNAFLDPDNGFIYDQDIPEQDDDFGVEHFLTGTRRGFCQQFAGAMAVLLRTLGIPARVAVGYATGTPIGDRPGTWVVTTEDAHAWVEVRFPDYGWLAFEPTPSRAPGAASIFPYTSAARGDTSCRGADCDGGPIGRSPAGAPAESPGQRRQMRPDVPTAAPASAGALSISLASGARAWPDLVGWITLVGCAVLVVVVGAALLGSIRYLRRRRRLHASAGDSRACILVTYDIFMERMAASRLGRRPAETIEEHRRRLLASLETRDGDRDIGALCCGVTLAAYGAAVPDPDLAASVSSAARSAVRIIRRERRSRVFRARLSGRTDG
jgi:transglutaminase-like putative cysteine protease